MIPLYVGAALFALSNMYHMRVSSTFVGTYKDKVYFYLTHLIDLAPMILYTFKMIEVGMLDVPKSRGFFTIFYMEWIFATTLMLLSLGRLVQLPLATYIRLATVDALMITGGYISMLGTSTTAIYAPFGVSSLCFLYMLYTIWRSYRTHTRSALRRVGVIETAAAPPTTAKKIHKKAFWGKVYKALTYVTMTTWLGYPANHILYKAGVSSFGTCLLVNVALDVVSKLLFVNILIGSHLVYRGDTSVLALMSRRMLKIHALDVTITETIDANMKHEVTLKLDMRNRRDQGSNEPTVTHLTHVSELDPVNGSGVTRSLSHSRQVTEVSAL